MRGKRAFWQVPFYAVSVLLLILRLCLPPAAGCTLWCAAGRHYSPFLHNFRAIQDPRGSLGAQ